MNDSNKTELTREWFRVQEQLKELKDHESELRKQVVSAYFESDLQAGTHKAPIKEGVTLVVSVPKKVTIDKGFFEEHKAELTHRGFIGEDRLIKPKYEVSVSALKHLSDADKAKFGEVFVHSTGSPSVSVEIKKD
jgi:hypothetical protein